MTLPAHLAKYDGLIDLLVEAIVREIEADSQTPETRKPRARPEQRGSLKGLNSADSNLPAP